MIDIAAFIGYAYVVFVFVGGCVLVWDMAVSPRRRRRTADPSPGSFRASVRVDHATPSPIDIRFTAEDDARAAITLIAMTEARR